MPMSCRTNFYGETAACMFECSYIFCNSLFNNQVALLFNINILTGYIYCKDLGRVARSSVKSAWFKSDLEVHQT